MATSRRNLLGLGRRLAAPPAPVAIASTCLARCFVHCQSCADICPEQAIRFTPRLGGPPLPELLAARCTGCGECIASCPVNAITLTPEAAHA